MEPKGPVGFGGVGLNSGAEIGSADRHLQAADGPDYQVQFGP